MFFEIFFGIIVAVLVLSYPRQILFILSAIFGTILSFLFSIPSQIRDSIKWVHSRINYRKVIKWTIITAIIVLVGSIRLLF